MLPLPNNRNRDASDTINDTIKDTLNDNVRATYTIIRLNPGIQRKGIADISGRSVAAIGRHLAIFMKEGLIEHRDSNKTGEYFVESPTKRCKQFETLFCSVSLYPCEPKTKHTDSQDIVTRWHNMHIFLCSFSQQLHFF